jgi:RAD51-like protein 2
VKHQIAKATTVHHCAVVITSQLATKLLTAENKPANFDTGDRAVLMPQLGKCETVDG